MARFSHQLSQSFAINFTDGAGELLHSARAWYNSTFESLLQTYRSGFARTVIKLQNKQWALKPHPLLQNDL